MSSPNVSICYGVKQNVSEIMYDLDSQQDVPESPEVTSIEVKHKMPLQDSSHSYFKQN